ncbi:ribosome maturation factor RimP [Thermodesulfobacteriota bacterium]
MINTALIRNQVFDIASPILEDIGFELIDVEYLSVNGRWILRLYIDKEGGVTIDDCVSVSRELGDLLDVKDIINHEYVLEVSSPGLNRPLKREKDFIKYIGKKIKCRMAGPVDGQKIFSGLLKDLKEGRIFLKTENGIVELSLDDIEKANLVYEFGN